MGVEEPHIRIGAGSGAREPGRGKWTICVSPKGRGCDRVRLRSNSQSNRQSVEQCGISSGHDITRRCARMVGTHAASRAHTGERSPREEAGETMEVGARAWGSRVRDATSMGSRVRRARWRSACKQTCLRLVVYPVRPSGIAYLTSSCPTPMRWCPCWYVSRPDGGGTNDVESGRA